jgi:TetR/AcrR family transcriptional regulator, copper-responsive repressor
MQKGTKMAPKVRRGRPRAFDEAQALAALTETFWVHGFAATSVDALAAAAGINRPSLYAAFGNKQAAYLRVVAGFAARLEEVLAATLAEDRPLADGLGELYRKSLALYLSGAPEPRGCLVVCTATAAALDEPEVKQALAKVLRVMDRALEKRLELARTTGELPGDANPRALALLASGALHSLAVRARAGESRATLLLLADTAVKAVVG